MTCEKTQSVTVFGTHKYRKMAVLFNPRCKMWDCDYCAEMNKADWIHTALRGTLVLAMEGQRIQFVTLTSRPYSTPITGLYFLKENWPRLNRTMRYHTNKWTKQLGLVWSYLMVPEKHKTGVVHCHLLAATHYDTEKSWKDFAFGAGFGWKVDAQGLVTPSKAAAYVAKYLHKGQGKEDWPKGFRRVRKSNNWPISEPQIIPGWEWATYRNEDTIWQEKHALIDLGYEVIDNRQEK